MDLKKILFVDDETSVLEKIRHDLQDMGHVWDIRYTDNGFEALGLIRGERFDAIISDINMPDIDGPRLLSEVMRSSPFTARFALSDQSDKELAIKSVGPTHQHFSKPCDMRAVKDALKTSLALREVFQSSAMAEIIPRIKSLPSLPKIYLDIVRELQREDPSMDRITDLIEADLGFGTKILQIVNSSFFGVPNHISSIRQAVGFLGLDTIKSLVLYAKVFSEFKGRMISASYLDALMGHSMTVAKFAKIIGEKMGFDKDELDKSFTSACFHDVGKLIFCAYMPKEYKQVLDLMRNNNCAESIAEKAVMGVTHSEVGAYLLCLWGLKDEIVESILFHHAPSQCGNSKLRILPVVHASDRLYYDTLPDSAKPPEAELPFDSRCLLKYGWKDQFQEWRALCAKSHRISR